MTIHYNYKTVQRPDGTQVKTPSIPIVLKGKEIIPTIGLLDSGADISAMSIDFAKILGLDLNKEKTASYGIGGRVDSIETSVNILVEKGHEKYSFNIPIKVILGNYDFPVLLGRNGFFDKFIISFDQKQERVSLKKIV